jgi:Icc-related predicted phosphoesterase
VIRIAAVGDVHAGSDSVGRLAPGFVDVDAHADVLLLAGDLTKCGTPEEALVLARELRDIAIPKVAVLGNHDHHDSRPEAVVDVLVHEGIRVLEGSSLVLDVAGERLGVAGVKGFCGGFAAPATAFGEPEMKAFVHHTQAIAQRLEGALCALVAQDCTTRVALLHYAPIAGTLGGEPVELHPLLGSQLLAEVVDRVGADLVLHGHAHAGVERGETPGGIPVRNVAMPVLGQAYRVYEIGRHRADAELAPVGMSAAAPRS